jgi:FAD:protein FMN transferase
MRRAPHEVAPAKVETVRLTHTERAMGTVFSFVALAATEDESAVLAAISEAAAWLHEVDRRFTTFTDDSEWLAYARGEQALDDAHPDLRHVVERARELTEQTHGAFSLTADRHRLADPAAYVKGWAIQRAAGLVLGGRAEGVLVNGGGDIMVTRRAEPWRVGIQDPHDPAGLVAVVEIEHGAVATSGAYERGAHVFDPALGRSSDALASATVVGPDLGLADGYSTALFASGEGGLDWFRRLDGYGAYLVRHDGSTVAVGAIRLS